MYLEFSIFNFTKFCATMSLDLTPIQKAKQLGIYNIWIMSIFPTVILQEFYREVSAISNSEMSQYVFTKDHYKIFKKYIYLKMNLFLKVNNLYTQIFNNF